MAITTTQKTVTRGSDMESVRKDYTAHVRRNTDETFWNLLRVRNGLTLKDISDITGMSVWSVSAKFTGRVMASETEIKMFCELFGVPIEKGRVEFQNGFSTYHGGGKTKTIMEEPRRLPPKTKVEIESLSTKEEEPIMEKKPEPSTETASNKSTININDLLRIAYDHIDEFEDYIKLASLAKECQGDPKIILKWLFKKVDYDTFCDVISIIQK